LKSSGAEHPWLGFLGLLLLGLALRAALHWQLDAGELARLYQAGFARNAVALLDAASVAPNEAEVLRKRLERALAVSAHDPERLRAVPPYAVSDDGRYWPFSSDLAPAAAWRLDWDGAESGVLQVSPRGMAPWRQSTRSQALVRPDWSAFSGLVAYYDLGRVWIADVSGLRHQSLVQEPALEQGGQLRFSADGTALAFYDRNGRRWMAQDLYVLLERP
jgi:hypothetical protein